MKRFLTLVPHVLALFIAGVFLDSLRYKFIDHPNTQVIFGKLNDWAGAIGFPGTFSPTGIFSQYVIGSAELLASALLVFGIFPAARSLQGFGALLALAIMTGAISFHLFTPLGTDPNNDGGGLFVAACLVWLASLVLVIVRFKKRT
jgi:hypothetical protein